jgi:hypothetical protein
MSTYDEPIPEKVNMDGREKKVELPTKGQNPLVKLIMMKTKKMSDPDVMFQKTEETKSTNVQPGKNDSDYTNSHMPNLGLMFDGNGMPGSNGGFQL